MTFNNPLDLENLLVNTLAGDWTIFLFLALIVITILAARFRMNNITMFMMIGLFAVIMAVWIPWFYAFMIFILAIGIGFIISGLIKK